MVNSNSFNCNAENKFSKSKPLGVMSTAVGTGIAVSWEPVEGAGGYEVYEAVEQNGQNIGALTYCKVKQTKKCKIVLSEKEPGNICHYYIRAYKVKKNGKREYSKKSKKVSTTVATEGISTIKNLLQTAIAPIGSTMYVWGGGWNKKDTAAGKEAKRIGLSPTWRNFAATKTSLYNYRNYRYQIHNGLDCSGYVGWCVYNVLNTQNNQKGYVYLASRQAKEFAGLGFGTYIPPELVTDYQAGDIMSSSDHVWMVVGACDDGSVVLIHSSQVGVQLCGTATPVGKIESEAYALAKKYMKKYYKTWYEKYPNVSRGSSYLTGRGQMRWITEGEGIVLSDPEGYQKMGAEAVLEDLFGE